MKETLKKILIYPIYIILTGTTAILAISILILAVFGLLVLLAGG